MNSVLPLSCAVCRCHTNLSRCSRCRNIYYCNKEHQRQDWKRHKAECKKLLKSQTVLSCAKSDIDSSANKTVVSSSSGTITYEGSSECEILSACTQNLSSNLDLASKETANETGAVNCDSKDMVACVSDPQPRIPFKEYPEVSLSDFPVLPPYLHNKNSFGTESSDPFHEICLHVIRDMNAYGVCVLDNFLGKDRGQLVLQEVLQMYNAGIFKDGQLVSTTKKTETRTIRGDEITWLDGKEPHCPNIGLLIQQVDNIIMRANKMPNNGKLGDYTITGRTKAMAACYPSRGSHYVKHVDNPNKDGRCITAIYYMNVDWDVTTCGGLLRIFPEKWQHKVADIAPLFDRILFFWSDNRNPHEVQPAFKRRFAITLWYFDAVEREEATRRYREKTAEASTSK